MRGIGVLVLVTMMAQAQPSRQTPGNQMEMLKQVGFDQKLNSQLPLHLPFRDHTGRQITLGDVFQGKPVVLVPVYFECPMLCNLSMSGLVKSLKVLSLQPGIDYNVVMFSIDPKETPALAAEKRKAYMKQFHRPGTDSGWQFLVGDETSVRALTEAIGFRYVYDKTIQQYAHAAGVVVATAGGRLARYLYGIDYAPKDLKLGIVEAAEGKIGDPVSQLLLMCFHYDPSLGKYTMSVMTLVRVAGIATLLAMGLFVASSLRKGRNEESSHAG
jgi:protein SCO1/2